MDKPAKILTVDDEEKIRKILGTFLEQKGYEVTAAENGAAALDAVERHSPDIVLTDVQMPEMDGFELCRQLKRKYDFLPVLMITSFQDRDSRLTGIKCGADDFLAKPIDFLELELKVKNFLRTKSLYDGLEKSYRELKELEKTKDDLTTFIVHDLLAPVAGLKGYLGLLESSGNIKGQELEDVRKSQHNVELLVNMISNLKDISGMESGEIKIQTDEVDLGEAVLSAIDTIGPLAAKKSLRIINGAAGRSIRVIARRDYVERVVLNILHNAVRFTPDGGEITISSHEDEQHGFAVVSISDNGLGVPEEYSDRIFDKFATVELKKGRGRHSTGLGLTFCKLAVELHGGRIWMEPRGGGGSVFRFTLPVSKTVEEKTANGIDRIPAASAAGPGREF